MNDLLFLDELVAPFDGEPADWADVLRRTSRRHPRRRLVLAAAAVVAALAAASAVAVPLLRSDGPKLPAAADRRNVIAMLQPRTGRVLIEAAPWKGHDGICYLVVGQNAGCVVRGAHKSIVAATSGYVRPSGRSGPALWGYTFDRRVASAMVFFSDGSHRRLPLHPFGGKLRVTFLGPIPIDGRGIMLRLYDSAGRQIKPG